MRKLTEKGEDVEVHDPYVKHWREFKKRGSYPAPGRSLARIFRNQEWLTDLVVHKNIRDVFPGSDAVILAVRQEAYKSLDPDHLVELIGQPAAIIDCFGLLDDDAIRRFFELGCEVKGLGRGHVKRIKDGVRQSQFGSH